MNEVLVHRQSSGAKDHLMALSSSDDPAVDVLMIGTGEYTTGYAQDAPPSDKKAGVVALTMFDLRTRGKVARLVMAGANGKKFTSIRAHMERCISSVYAGMKVDLDTYPADDCVDPKAYITALDSLPPGSAVTIFTPDDTHFDIAMACIEKGMHVLITKPAVQTLEQHRTLAVAAAARNVLVATEVHKRWDPMYTDARDRLSKLGPFSYFYSYMSQPKTQLSTFQSWAGRSSDISYYLNSHHVDFHEWVEGTFSRPVSVSAMASKGVASSILGVDCEDTITLVVQWENLNAERGVSQGTAVYTSSWIAPRSDVHSQQRFFYMGQHGEITIDQAHRGYSMASDQVSKKFLVCVKTEITLTLTALYAFTGWIR